MKIDDNPFEQWDLDPRDDMRKLTATMRERTLDLAIDEREELQAGWRELTSDPVTRAQWIVLTPPPVSKHRDPWKAAEEIVSKTSRPKVRDLEPTMEDALVLPLMDTEQLYARPPFLPELLSRRHRKRSPEENE